jgi:hypothetical protein
VLQTAENDGGAFIFFRRPVDPDPDETRDEWSDSEFVVVPLNREKMDVGRDPKCEVAISWDGSVSKAHAELVEVGSSWRVKDVGSLNGTQVNGIRVNEQLIANGDLLRFGDTLMVFRQPEDSGLSETIRGQDIGPPVTEAQRKILIELVRPMESPGGIGEPATNAEIADSLHLSEDTVKQHLRKLFHLFDIDKDEKRNRKRMTLARRVLETGIVSPSDLH